MDDVILDQYITVALLGSGHAAVHMVLVDDDDGDPYWDIQQTSIGRYNNSKDAETEAKQWSESDGIRLQLKEYKDETSNG